jgi:ribonucleoside-diphosphate reductase beta chain
MTLKNLVYDNRVEKEVKRIWKGDTDHIMRLNDIKYNWATALYRQMRQNIWIPQKVDLTPDVTSFNSLTNAEKTTYKGILSYLTFLDSIQTNNIPNIIQKITAPEIKLCLAEQLSQEAMHNESYQYVIETVIPIEERESIYNFCQTNFILKERCEYIANLYNNYVTFESDFHYFIALVADYVLESLYFYNGFIVFYTLAFRQSMSATADIIKLIHRDEKTHVVLYQNLLLEALKNNIFNVKGDVEIIKGIFREACEQEIKWSHYICKDFLGVTEESIENYTKWLVNTRAIAIGIGEIYEKVSNPYKHLDNIADISSSGGTKTNFFEAGVTAYNTADAIDGWDF